MTKRPANNHHRYHAHIYFNKETQEIAKEICEKSKELFHLDVGRLHEKSVGPHPRWSCRILFNNNDFDSYIPWLDKNRKGLTVLVHGVTGNDIQDHTEYAYWLGDEIPLKLSFFEQLQSG